MKKTIFLLALIFFTGISHFAVAQNSEEIITKMLKAIEGADNLTFKLKTWERFEDGKTVYGEVDTKLATSPMKLYIFSHEPNKDVEILWNPDLYEDKALVNAKSWLPNLKLSPYGKQMRKDQHHTILNTGFGFFHGIISNAVARAKKEGTNPSSPYYGEEFGKYFEYKGDITWNGIDCYKVVITDPTFSYVDYTVKNGETVETLSKQHFICGYQIIEKNSNVNWFDDLEAGMKIKLPSSYAKLTTLYIDKRNYMPVVQIMHDENGQFEKYEFHNLKVNPGLKNTEFTPEFDGYNF